MTTHDKGSRPRGVAVWMRKRGWSYGVPRNGLRRRAYELAIDHRPWWDWGHRLMTIVGIDEGGNRSEPRPSTWWYRQGPAKRSRITHYPTHPPSTYQIVTDYDEFRKLIEGLNEDEMYPWQAFYVGQDGELGLGRQYWGGQFHGLSHWDVPILLRYLVRWRLITWFGLRTWLYNVGLNRTVYARKPFACNQVPPRGSGGYDHWHCPLKRSHAGMHRYNAYVWGEVGGETVLAHAPELKVWN